MNGKRIFRHGRSLSRWSLALLAGAGSGSLIGPALLPTASGAAPGGTKAIPVIATTVRREDMPIYLEGLGQVQALNTVTIRSQVDGKVATVAFHEGQTVNAGDLLFAIDPAPYQAALDQTVAKRAQDETQLVYAQKMLKRDADLTAKGMVQQQALELQQATVDQLAALIKADDAAIASAKLQLDYTRITSPIGGRVGFRLVDSGNIVRASEATPMAMVTQVRPIAVVLALPEQRLRRIIEAAKQASPQGALPVLAMDPDNHQVLERGTLAALDGQIDAATGTIKLKASFANQDDHLWPGQFVNARLLLETRRQSLVVPSAVVQRGPDGDIAYVVKDDMTVDLRSIKVAQVTDGLALVTAGLAAGERVVLEGQLLLQAGTLVQLGKSGNGPSLP